MGTSRRVQASLLLLFLLPYAESSDPNFGYPSFNVSQLFDYPGGYNESINSHSLRPLKFQHWYPAFSDYFSFISEGLCNITLLGYEGSLQAREEIPPVFGYCAEHLTCMLSMTNQAVQANMAATSVLLGLTPSILASLGPTVAEVSLLSLRRPLLAILVSLGAPAVYPSRVAVYDDPFAAYHPKTGDLAVPQIPSMWTSATLSVSQYILAAAAVVNVIQVSYNIGLRGVQVWWCEFSFAPIFWSLLTGVIHLTAALALRVSLSDPNRRTQGRTKNTKSILGLITHFVKRETTLSCNDRDLPSIEGLLVGPVGIGLNIFAGWLGLCHVAFGTAVFSGLLFISTGDAALVLLRYLASGTLCRLIIYFEIGGMKRVEDERRTFRWIVQAKETTSEHGDHGIDQMVSQPESKVSRT